MASITALRDGVFAPVGGSDLYSPGGMIYLPLIPPTTHTLPRQIKNKKMFASGLPPSSRFPRCHRHRRGRRSPPQASRHPPPLLLPGALPWS
ncbi:hypothetical protein MRB53_029021 [Persea americana]|uniref:Uncharacterized protein n=1 Tax=Persea americana TaxID=3435 RepID=A0ACC2KHL3_PERAE|nr:hypothetical protein MRB53_029021 [Persea americana]